MTQVQIAIHDVLGHSPSPGDRIWVRAAQTRSASTGGVVVPSAVPVEVHDDPTIELEPGPARVRFELKYLVADQGREFPIVVPDEGPVTLRELLNEAYQWSSEELKEFAQLRDAAQQAAADATAAADSAEADASTAQTAAGVATTKADEAGASASDAGASAAASLAHAEEAGVQRWAAVDERWAAVDARNLAIGAKDDAIVVRGETESLRDETAGLRDGATTQAGIATSEAEAAALSALEALGYRDAAGTHAGTASSRAAEAAVSALTLVQRIEGGTRQLERLPSGRLKWRAEPQQDISLRVDTSVGTRVFVGNTMIYGDTGWRDLHTVLRPEWVLWATSGTPPASPSANTFARFRRVGDLVEFSARIGPSSLLTGVNRFLTTNLFDIPVGFRPHRAFIRVGEWWSFDDSVNGLLRVQSASVEARNGSGTWRANELVLCQAQWSTSDSWPAVLPGVA